MIIGPGDSPLMFMDLSSEGFRDDSPHLDEFVIHAALDAVDALLVRMLDFDDVISRSHTLPKVSYELLTGSTIST